MKMEESSVWISPAISFVLVFFTSFLLYKAAKLYKWFNFFHNLPGMQGYSLLLGNLQHIPKNGEGRLKLAVDLMGHNFRFHRIWFGPFNPVLNTYHPETVHQILASPSKSRGVGSIYEIISEWIGEGLIVTNGSRWARSRRLLTPAFHFDILKDYFSVYNQAADNLFKKLDPFAESGESVDIYQNMSLCTLEVILKCSLGYDCDIQGHGHPYATAVAELQHLIMERIQRPWLWPNWMFALTSRGKTFYKHCNYVHKFAEDIIEQRKQTLEKDDVPKGHRLDFIDILLTAKDEEGNTMTNKEIRNEVDTFMFAGHDTTASAIPWCLYTLASNPDYQEKVQEELDAVMEGRDVDDIGWEDLAKLPVLTACVKESLRLYPPVPFIQRQLEQDTLISGNLIPAGTYVNISIYLLHRNPSIWEDPHTFRPERFLAENRDHDLYSFLPFSAGSRNCIGQSFALNEDKVIVGRILRRYKIRLAKDHEEPLKNPVVVLRSAKGIWLELKQRQM